MQYLIVCIGHTGRGRPIMEIEIFTKTTKAYATYERAKVAIERAFPGIDYMIATNGDKYTPVVFLSDDNMFLMHATASYGFHTRRMG